MSGPAANAAHVLIADTLAEELRELESFRAILAEEQECLLKAEIERLTALAQRKGSSANTLGTLLIKREQALASQGFPTGRAGMQVWLSTQKPGSAVHKHWEALLELAEKARAEHELNGKLIAIQLQHNQQALTAILSASGRTLTYGPDGQQHLGGGGRRLGSA